MVKRRQRGGSDTNDITSNPIIILSGALVSIFSVIIPILLYLKYELIVKILTGVYGFFLFIFSAGVVSTDLNLSETDNYYNIIIPDSILFSLMAIISIGMIVLATTYKHITYLFPLTIGLILSVVLIRISQVPLDKSNFLFTFPKIALLISACVTFLLTILSQNYIHTIGSA
jgi:hypothetical protein